MAIHNDLGKCGEAVAEDFLCKKGYMLLARNYRTKRGELDLVFRDKKQIIFVEVKTRTYLSAFDSFIPINKTKKRAIYSAVRSFLHQERLRLAAWDELRFDLIYVTQGRVTEHMEGEGLL
jgi:putative endonuclease